MMSVRLSAVIINDKTWSITVMLCCFWWREQPVWRSVTTRARCRQCCACRLVTRVLQHQRSTVISRSWRVNSVAIGPRSPWHRSPCSGLLMTFARWRHSLSFAVCKSTKAVGRRRKCHLNDHNWGSYSSQFFALLGWHELFTVVCLSAVSMTRLVSTRTPIILDISRVCWVIEYAVLARNARSAERDIATRMLSVRPSVRQWRWGTVVTGDGVVTQVGLLRK